MGAKGTRSRGHERAKMALGEWLAKTPGERLELGLPDTMAEFAVIWGVARRTVIRWKKDDELVALAYKRSSTQEKTSLGTRPYNRRDPVYLKTSQDESEDGDEESQGVRGGASNGEPAALAALERGDPLSQEFEEIRQALVADAKRGGKGLDAYMRYIGKHVLDQERAAQEAGFTDLSDEELVSEVLGLIGREAVESWLAVAVPA